MPRGLGKPGLGDRVFVNHSICPMEGKAGQRVASSTVLVITEGTPIEQQPDEENMKKYSIHSRTKSDKRTNKQESWNDDRGWGGGGQGTKKNLSLQISTQTLIIDFLPPTHVYANNF